MPTPEPTIPWSEERVIFENWEADGCHIFVGGKHVLTLNTPESSKCDDLYRAYLEDWISPEEFCAHLTAILRALGASPAVLAQVEQERENYRERPVEPPQRTHEDLLREVTEMPSKGHTA